MSTGFTEPLVHSPRSNQAQYAYRSGKGIIPSAEWVVFHDEMVDSPASNALPGYSTVIDVGATLTAAATDGFSGGIVAIASDGVSEGVVNYLPKTVQIGTKKWFMEVRCYTVAANDTDVQFGLSIANATTNPEDLWTTAATDLIAFGVLDGDATPGLLVDKNNSGTTVSKPSGTAFDLSDATWHTLAIEGQGTSFVKAYVDGQLAVSHTTAATIPDDAVLVPFFGARTGGVAGNLIYFDYLRFSIER